jgi:6-pyruvoyltetrahydropterin/6-carboxytetrahydropterin synthase
MYTIAVRAGFKASHSVRVAPGPREAPHAHDWLVEAEVGADALDGDGLVMDFRRLARLLAECIADFEGALLDELPAFAAINPTAENVAHVVYRGLEAGLAEGGGTLVRVTVWEAKGCSATYRPR